MIFTDEARFSLDGLDKFINWQLKDNMGDFNRSERPFDGGGVMVHVVLGPETCLMVTRLHWTIDSKKIYSASKRPYMTLY